MRQLKNIMDTEITRKHNFKSMEEIHQFENGYNISFPAEYEQFLLEYGSGYIKDNYYYKALESSPLTSEDGYNSTDYFYGSDIVENIEIYDKELNKKLIPIADAGGGDFICIGVRDEYKEKILYWSHDSGDGESIMENLYLIANSFKDFIKSFEEYEQNISFDDIELFLDDDLLSD